MPTADQTLPTSVELDRNWIRTGNSVHHTYAVEEWPRLDVTAEWMEPLIFNHEGTRTLTVSAEPVPPSRSRPQVERDATKIVTDGEQRERAGFRVGAEHQRTALAIAEREEEITSSFVEFIYSGTVTITADDQTILKQSCVDYEQAAAQAGIGLQPLSARHDLGLACSLPVGRAATGRRFS